MVYFPNFCIGIERPDIRQLGILSFATIVHNAYFGGRLSESSFDKYVSKYFDLFLGKMTPAIYSYQRNSI